MAANKEMASMNTSMLPDERMKLIGGLNSVAAQLADPHGDVLKRLVQSSEAEEHLSEQVAEEGTDAVMRTVCECIRTVHNLDMVVSLLELACMILKVEPNLCRAISVYAHTCEKGKDPGIFLDKWTHEAVNEKVMEKSIEVFCLILAGSEMKYADQWLKNVLLTIHDKLKEAQGASETNVYDRIASAQAAVRGLSILCGPTHLRELVVTPATSTDISPPALLPSLLFPGESVFATAVESRHQFVYEALKTIWQLTFTGEVLDELDSQCRPRGDSAGQSVITVLNNLLKKQKKEKCIRMTLLTLNNYIARHQSVVRDARTTPNYVKDMIGVGMVQNLEMLQKRTFGDEDILPDVQSLFELLETNVEDLSSYAQYKQEIASGVLEWSPPHTSEKFWRENIKAFEADQYKPIKELSKVIRTSKKALNVQIACHDMGEFVRHHPQGKRQWEALNIKERVYELIENGLGNTDQEKEAVKRHALLGMQKIMVQRWDLL